MNDHVMRPLEAKEVPALAQMLAAAFVDDPAYGYLMHGVEPLAPALAEFYERNLRVHLPYRCTHVMADASGGIVATVTLRPPQGVPISMLTMLRHGLLPFAFDHGLAAVKRLLWLKDTYDALEAEITTGPHFYVHMMAVRPEFQGQGHGSRLLAHVLEAARHQHSNTLATRAMPTTPTTLGTHQTRNVTYYERLGFTVTKEQTLHPPGAAPYTIWSMRSA